VTWTYSPDEWEGLLGAEVRRIKRKIRTEVLSFLGYAAALALLLFLFRGLSVTSNRRVVTLVVLVVVMAGVLVLELARLVGRRRRIEGCRGGAREVRFAPGRVTIGGQVESWDSRRWVLRAVKTDGAAPDAAVVFQLRENKRRGEVSDVSLPVPATVRAAMPRERWMGDLLDALDAPASVRTAAPTA
jgi:hypothetical protein